MEGQETKGLLITGGLGYIGSHTIVELCNKEFKKENGINDDYEIIIVDACYNASTKILPLLEEMTKAKISFYKIDMCDKQKLEEVFQKHKIYGVIHFAGFKSVNESVKNPLSYYENNLVSTMNLISLCLKYKVNNLIFSSSCTVYGMKCEGATEEQTELVPINPYGKTKLYIENILKDVAKANKDFKVILLRYCNPVAAHPDGKIGENPLGGTLNLFPVIENLIRGKRKELIVFGKDYPTRDGTCIRDYVHVSDIGRGHVLTLKAFNKENENLFTDNCIIYNMGTSNGASVKEVIDAYEKSNNIKLNWKYGERRAGDAAIAVPNSAKIRKELGWDPKCSLEQMCKDSYNFVKKYPDGIY